MIENYKGWVITLTWDDQNDFKRYSDRYISFNQKEKWKGVNSNGSCIYGASLKEIRHFIDYPFLQKIK